MNTLPASEFQWRSATGKYYRITEMETGHLYRTFLVIWNHTMPRIAQTPGHIRHTFGKQYTVAYFLQAIKAMLPELCNRKNLLDSQWSVLLDMKRFLETYHVGTRQMELL